MKRWLRKSLSKTTSGLVRSGFLAVYVGLDRRKFVVPTRYMNYTTFTMLLEKTEEEIGSQPAGGLVLTCEVAFFQWVLDALERDEARFKTLGIEEFTRYRDCFAKGVYCDGCNCVNYCNNVENETARHEAIEATLERNPNAFRPKIGNSPHANKDNKVLSTTSSIASDNVRAK